MNTRNIPDKGKMNQIESKVNFENLKSNYILKIIISYMKINKSLKVIKCTKTLQKRLNINIKDYKECYKLTCTPIELKLKLVDNDYGIFINISDKDKKYIQIYFNNSNEEIKKIIWIKMKMLRLLI